MSNYVLLTIDGKNKKREESENLEIDFSVVKIGDDKLAIQQGGTGVGAHFNFSSHALKSTFVAQDDSDLVNKLALDTALASIATGSEWQDSVLSRKSAPVGGEVSGDRYLITAFNSLPIVNLYQVSKKFLVDGNYTSVIGAANIIKVKNSTGNNNYYTVSTATFNGVETEITVLENIINATVDGQVVIASGAFAMIGVDKIARFNGTSWVLSATPTNGMFVLVDDESAVAYQYGYQNWSQLKFDKKTASNGVKIVGDDIQRDDTVPFQNIGPVNIFKNQVCYISGGVYVAIATNPLVAERSLTICEDASVSVGQTGKFITREGAFVTGFTGLIAGRLYYLSNTVPGGIDLLENISYNSDEEIVLIGEAMSATTLKFTPMPEYTY